MSRILDTLKTYKELLAGLLVIGAISAWVAHGIAAEAEKKADANALALQAVAQTQAILAQTQQDLAKQQAMQTGKLDGFLSTLGLAPEQLEAVKSLPHDPKKNAKGDILCGQSWLYASKGLDTIIVWAVSKDSCKVNGWLVHPKPEAGS